NQLVARAMAKGKDLFAVLKAACISPILHYKLEVGQLREGDWADVVVINDLNTFEIAETYINGEKVAENGKTLIPSIDNNIINNFQPSLKKEMDFRLQAKGSQVRVIEALDGQLITPISIGTIKVVDGWAEPNLD